MERSEHAALDIRLLGGFAVRVGERPVPEQAWRLRRAKSLVKLLALAPERRLHREQATELLWPERAPAANALHQVLYTARRAVAAGGRAAASDGGGAGIAGGDAEGSRVGAGTAVAADWLTLRDDVIALTGNDVIVDVDLFELAAAEARAMRDVAAYERALALYAGELLPEDRYEAWAAPRRESLRETRLALLVELADVHGAAGDDAAAVEALQQTLVDDPLHEPAHRALMRSFAATGRRQQALAQYQSLRDALERSLAADPDPATRALYQEILASQHEVEQPPASDATAAEPLALPRQLTSFVGRARELGVLSGVLSRARLLTLTGPGGCGKSRLALELAARSANDFVDGGVHVVDLAPVADSALVIEETAAALGVTPRSQRDPVDLLGDQLGAARALLVLDNCEHLIAACAGLADRLLRRSPNLRVLATSREPLRIDGEIAWRVPPLSLPEIAEQLAPDELHSSEAIRLFCDRASHSVPSFALTADNAAAVAEVCRRLDGMPLALELAAARITVLSPAQIAERLGDALALLRGGSRTGLTRQQTLRATLAWSHDLLTAAERVLYRRLGVFAGSFGVDAIDGVCADEAGLYAGAEALDLLAQLADKSLVQVEQRDGRGYRYRMLETVRQHAREQLMHAGEAKRIEAAHRAWYLTLAAAADRDLDPARAATWPVQRLGAEHDDLRAALASALRDDPPAALELAGHLWWYWMARGQFVEGSRWVDDALAATLEPAPLRIRALWALAALDVRRSGAIRTVGLSEEALAIARRSSDPHTEARALARHGVLAMGGFDWAVADAAFAEGLALAREHDDAPVTVAIIHAQAVLAGCRGETSRARALLADALERLERLPDECGPLFWAQHISPIVLPTGPGGTPRLFFEDTFCLFRAVGSSAGAAYALLNIGETWRIDGEPGRARNAFEQSLARFRASSDDQGVAVVLNALGNLARIAGTRTAADATACFEAALTLRRAARDTREIATTLLGMGMLALYRGDADDGRGLVEEARTIFARSEDGPGLQAIPVDLGAYELDHGDPARARALLRQCTELAQRRRIAPNLAWAFTELAEACVKLGEHDEAHAALERAREVFTASGDARGARYVHALNAAAS